MFTTRTISNIAYAVRHAEVTAKHYRVSANIGFGLLLFRSTMSGQAVTRTLGEIEAKAGQAALGMAAAMDTGDHRANIIKFGIDGLHRTQIAPVCGL
jgi:hypothetical protein